MPEAGPKSGGNISNAYGLHVIAPTIGTNNYAALLQEDM